MRVTSFKSGHKGWTPPWAKQVWARLLVSKKSYCPGFLVLLPSFQRIQIYRDFLGGLHALSGNSKLRMVQILVDQFHPKNTASTVYQFRNLVAIFPKLCSPQHSFAFHMIPGRAPPAASDPHAMLSVQIEISINHQLFSKLSKKTLIYVWGNNETFGSDKQECFLWIVNHKCVYWLKIFALLWNLLFTVTYKAENPKKIHRV